MSTDRATAARRPWRDGSRVFVRALTALVGGYTAAAGLATLAARLLPGSRVEATVWGMTPSFLIYAMIGLWAFHERRLLVVLPAIWGTAALFCGAALLLGIRP